MKSPLQPPCARGRVPQRTGMPPPLQQLEVDRSKAEGFGREGPDGSTKKLAGISADGGLQICAGDGGQI
jgi:hypothetical protein